MTGSKPPSLRGITRRHFFEQSAFGIGGLALASLIDDVVLAGGQAQPRGNEIKDAVLARRMPPWGAVKGFGNFRNDQSLMQEQIELFARWVDGGIRRGNNPRQLPKVPTFTAAARKVSVRSSTKWPSPCRGEPATAVKRGSRG